MSIKRLLSEIEFVCLIFSHFPVSDCLRLNVYVPNTADFRNRLPVMIWIHGGGFETGSTRRGLYGPKFLVRHHVILVAINYRLGPYGFMCLNTSEVPGNQGLKDQLIALRWIKNNIEAFGGDANEITVFGESAGSRSVDFHMHFTEENLFNKAILQSGSASGCCDDPDTNAHVKLAHHLGLLTNVTEEALSYLATVDPELVIAATNELSLAFRPNVEHQFDGVENFIKDSPVSVDNLKYRNIPIMIGNTNDEFLFVYAFVRNVSITHYSNVFYSHLQSSFNFEEQILDDMTDILKHFYIGDEDVTDDVKGNIIDFQSDIQYNYPTEKSVKKFQDNGDTIYRYIFSYNGGFNLYKRWANITEGGAIHADELGYLFSNEVLTETPKPEDQQVIDQMTILWTNFAKYGNPTLETSGTLPVKWEPITKDCMYYLNIDSELKLNTRPFKERMAFWDLFYKRYERNQNAIECQKFNSA